MPEMDVNKKLKRFLTVHKPLKIAYGGRGSGKSIGFGDMLTFKMDTEGADVYCLREYQDSVYDSVHRVFKGSIQDRLKLSNWTIQENRVVAPNGAQTRYMGAARNPDSIQSAEGYKYSWFEEAHRASQTSLDKLLPTILRNPGSECWFSANPQASGDPFSQRFIVPYQNEVLRNGYYEDDIHLIIKVNWRDNPWWNESQEKLRQWDYDNLDRAKYDWIWEGEFNDSVKDSIILAAWFDACIDAHEKLGFDPLGAKVVSHDPSDLGPDDKGLCLRHGSVILEAMSEAHGDVNEGCDWATGFAAENNADWFTWDGDGMGVSLRRQIQKAFDGTKTEIEMFRGSSSPENPDAVYQEPGRVLPDDEKRRTNRETFLNLRSQRYWMLRDRVYQTYLAVTKSQYIDPDQMISFSSKIKDLQKLRSELCRIPRKPNSRGLIQIMTKPEMKRLPEKIESPNIADAVMMSLMTPKNPVEIQADAQRYISRNKQLRRMLRV